MMMRAFARVALLETLIGVTVSAVQPLPLPEPKIPDNPMFPPTVITSAGQRLLLGHTDVEVRYDRESRALTVNRPGWWVINYPLTRIAGLEGKSENEIAQLLFGKPADEIKNHYLRTVGAPANEPYEPTGPAPIQVHRNPTLVVDQRHSRANDDNPATPDAPLKTIAAAVARAEPGTVIQVRPGIYREQIEVTTAGTRDRPIVLEGVRDDDGRMPAVSGNIAAPDDVWQPVAGMPGVWRAENWTGKPSNLTLRGSLMRERTIVDDLGPREYCHNYANRTLAFPRPAKELDCAREVRATDDEGNLNLGEQRGVFILSSWLWIPPGESREAWDPRHPEPVTG